MTLSKFRPEKANFYSPLLRCAGDLVESAGAKHAGAGLGDTIIKISHFFENYYELLRKKCFQPPLLNH